MPNFFQVANVESMSGYEMAPMVVRVESVERMSRGHNRKENWVAQSYSHLVLDPASG